jgi:hypothetical protein
MTTINKFFGENFPPRVDGVWLHGLGNRLQVCRIVERRESADTRIDRAEFLQILDALINDCAICNLMSLDRR